MTGKLLRIEDAPMGNGSSFGRPEHNYLRWKMVIQSKHGGEQHASTGRTDIIAKAKSLIGKTVTITRGGKEGIVGSIREGEETTA